MNIRALVLIVVALSFVPGGPGKAMRAHGQDQDKNKGVGTLPVNNEDHEATSDADGPHMAATDISTKDQQSAAHWLAPDAEQSRSNPIPMSDDGLATAAEIYEDNCAVCHGASGVGDGPAAEGLDPKPADLQVMASQHNHGDLAWKIRNGRNAMPAWGEVFDDETIWEIVNYLKEVIAKGVGETAIHGHDGGKHHHE